MNKLGIFMNFWEKNWDAQTMKSISEKLQKLALIYSSFGTAFALNVG